VTPSLIILAATFGGAAGAFLPRVAHRLAVPFAAPPRSACATCDRPFAENPSAWVRAGTACPCGGIAWPTIAATALVAALLAAALGSSPLLPVLLPVAVLGVLLGAIDLRCRRLPDPLVAALALLTVGPLTAAALVAGEPGRLGRAVAAAGLCGTAYLVLAILPGAGLGFGDVKLAAVLGFALGFAGWPAMLVGLVAPHVINGPIALFLLVTGRARRRTALPFGPALLTGALLAIVLA
jgi:leader peptidase (prepilin peptidase)/N-methyltransferase